VLVNQTYHPGKTTEWIDEINNKILQRLAEQQKSFKYVGKISIFSHRILLLDRDTNIPISEQCPDAKERID
jgi:hypothetical protein